VSSNNIYVFTDIDLDGTASLIALHWALNAKPGTIPFKGVTVTNFRKEFLKWAETDSINNYDAVYFLDLDTGNCIDLIDNPKSIIIDHHSTHEKVKSQYKNAKTNITVTSSCAKLVYNHFKDKLTLTPEQRQFIVLADDYDSYQFKHKETYNLNCLYTNTQRTLDKTRSHKFLERFYNGFDQFTQMEKNLIKDHITNRDLTIKNLQIFSGTVNLNKTPWKVTGTMGSKFVNEICDYLIKEHSSDIVFFINPNNSHVSFRKNKNCTIDLSKLSAKLCEGGGHEYAAGGKVTDAFMEFTKQLTSVV